MFLMITVMQMPVLWNRSFQISRQISVDLMVGVATPVAMRMQSATEGS